MSRRDGAIVAWHEVPGTAPPQKSRPVGYGVIRAGVRTDSMIGVTKFRILQLTTFVLYGFWLCYLKARHPPGGHPCHIAHPTFDAQPDAGKILTLPCCAVAR